MTVHPFRPECGTNVPLAERKRCLHRLRVGGLAGEGNRRETPEISVMRSRARRSQAGPVAGACDHTPRESKHALPATDEKQRILHVRADRVPASTLPSPEA